MTDGLYEPGLRYEQPHHKDFMKVGIYILWSRYVNLDMVPMRELCPDVRDDLVPIYDGGGGRPLDKEGNERPIPLCGSRPPG